MTNVLFEGAEIKQNTTILQILPESPFIFSCLDHIRNKNPECQAHVYIVTPRKDYMYFLFELLNVIKYNVKIDYFYNFDDEEELLLTYFDVFKECSEFDYIIQSNFNPYDLKDNYINRPKKSSFRVFSRIMYISPFNYTSIPDYWLKHDLLESLILLFDILCFLGEIFFSDFGLDVLNLLFVSNILHLLLLFI